MTFVSLIIATAKMMMYFSGSSDLFVSTVGNLSAKYELSFTPAGFTFSIWSVIYIWLAISIGFCKYFQIVLKAFFVQTFGPIWYLFLYFSVVYTLFSSSEMGKLYLNPEIITPWYSFFFISNLLYNLAWIFTWDREQIVGASILLFLIAKTNIIALGILARNIAQDGHQLREDKPKIYWNYVVLPMNAQGIYTTWTVIASLVNFGTALVYVAGVQMETASHVCLGTLLAVLIVYFVLENTILDNYIRLLLTPYLVVIWASIGILVKKQNDDKVAESTKNLIRAILGLACIFMALRIVIVVLRQLKRPLGRSGISQISDKPAF